MDNGIRISMLGAVLMATASIVAAATTPVYDAAAFYQTTDYSIADSERAYSPDGRKLLITANPTARSRR